MSVIFTNICKIKLLFAGPIRLSNKESKKV